MPSGTSPARSVASSSAASAPVTAVLVGSAFQVGLIPLSGWLSDKYGRRLVYGVGAVGGALWSVVFFAMASSVATVPAGVVIGLMFHSLMYGPQAAFVSEQFTESAR
jgi:MFS family permease